MHIILLVASNLLIKDGISLARWNQANAQQQSRADCPGPCILCWDFSRILSDKDKNNGNLHRRMMGRFPRCVNDLAFKEIYLNGWRDTWSNGQSPPTLVHLDSCSARLIGKGLLANGECHLRCLASIVSRPQPLVARLLPDTAGALPLLLQGLLAATCEVPRHRLQGMELGTSCRMQATANKLTELGW
jgi:hypothetical protein